MRGDRGPEGNRENWGGGRDEWRENDRNRESDYGMSEERNRGGEGRQGYDRDDWDRGRGREENYSENRRGYEGQRGQNQYGGNEGRRNEGRWNEGRGNEGRGLNQGFEGSRGPEASRGYQGGRGNEGEGERGYEGSRNYENSGQNWQRRDEQSRQNYASQHRGDYGPGAFNRQFQGGTEYFGTGQRGYGTTWGGSNAGYTGMGSGSGDQGGTGQYSDQGRFAGRGPKGYQRSDDRIREDVCERLTHHPEIDASEIDIQVKNGEVTLTGTVDRREEKRMAEDVAEHVSGVKDVHNQLRAQPQHAMAGQTQSTQGSTQGGGQAGQVGQGVAGTQANQTTTTNRESTLRK